MDRPEDMKETLVVGVGGAGEAIVGRWAKGHADGGVRFCVGVPGAKTLERAARVVVVVGLGGHSGGPRALLEATRAKARGATVTVLAVRPFTFEGLARKKRAAADIKALREVAEELRVFDNDDLLRDAEALDLQGAYLKCDGLMWCQIFNLKKEKTMELFSDKSLERMVTRIQAQKNWYLWPEVDPQTEGGLIWSKCPGYSYDLPKEEQVRCELACELRTRDLSVELEWNYYQPQDLRHTLKQEIDLAVFEEDCLHLVEVKRIWNELDIWVNKTSELVLAVQSDELRLRRIMEENQAVEYQFDAKSRSFELKPQPIEVCGYLLVASYSFDDPFDISNEISHRLRWQAHGRLNHVNEKRTRTVNFSLTALLL